MFECTRDILHFVGVTAIRTPTARMTTVRGSSWQILSESASLLQNYLLQHCSSLRLSLFMLLILPALVHRGSLYKCDDFIHD